MANLMIMDYNSKEYELSADELEAWSKRDSTYDMIWRNSND